METTNAFYEKILQAFGFISKSDDIGLDESLTLTRGPWIFGRGIVEPFNKDRKGCIEVDVQW